MQQLNLTNFIIKINISLFIIILVINTTSVYAQIQSEIGAFYLDVNTSTNTDQIFNLGLINVNYKHNIADDISFYIGYSLYISDYANIELGYGPNLGILYFPLGQTNKININTNNILWKTNSIWVPFVGLYFGQRQYQSVQSQYAGIGIIAGIEYAYSDTLQWIANIKYLNLYGPYKSYIKEFNIMFGPQFIF